MCSIVEDLAVAPIKLHSKFESKLSDNDPLVSAIERRTGWRPHTSTQLAADGLGINQGRSRNRYYSDNGYGYIKST